jgi:hypothetical protein
MAKGKTEHCHAEFNAPPTVIIFHPPNGWTDETAKMEYVAWLLQLSKGHRRLNIELWLGPVS